MDTENDREVIIQYTNWRGKTSLRRIIPDNLWFGYNEYYQDQQWLLTAFDIDKQASWTFAVKNIHEWIPKRIEDHIVNKSC